VTSVDALQVAQLPSANDLACYCVPLQRIAFGSIDRAHCPRGSAVLGHPAYRLRTDQKPDFTDC
jgi:hypothetical protein